MKTKYKYITVVKTKLGYECHAPMFCGLFLKVEFGRPHWSFLHAVTEAYCDQEKAQLTSKRWRDIADFLGQLNKGNKPK